MKTTVTIVLVFAVTAYAVPLKKSLPHIIRGRNAVEGEVPWQLSLENGGSHSCGAVIINPTNKALTAAHCVDGGSPDDLQVHYGQLRQSDSGFRMQVTDIIQHPMWGLGDGNNPNDIAILNLESEIPTSRTAAPIARAQPSDGDFAGADCQISGWGQTEEGFPPNSLKIKDVDVMTQTRCIAGWDETMINDGHICLEEKGVPGGGAACFGDSGGPLSCPATSASKVVAGLTSWGNGQCEGQPSVYTRVSVYKDFIDQNVGSQ